MKEKLNLLLCTKKRKRERELHISITSINQINHLPNLLSVPILVTHQELWERGRERGWEGEDRNE